MVFTKRKLSNPRFFLLWLLPAFCSLPLIANKFESKDHFRKLCLFRMCHFYHSCMHESLRYTVGKAQKLETSKRRKKSLWVVARVRMSSTSQLPEFFLSFWKALKLTLKCRSMNNQYFYYTIWHWKWKKSLWIRYGLFLEKMFRIHSILVLVEFV